MDLSIIIPVWNEESKIATDIRNINQHFAKSALRTELIIVDDGSSDSTIAVTKATFKNISLETKILMFKHRGKGHAVRQGMIASQGKISMFMDCGSNVSLKFIDKGIERLNAEKTDLVLGSRYHPQSKIALNMVWFRRITSSIFRNFTKLFLNLPKGISDSQCGFKLFKGNIAREIFSVIKTDGFLFDLEVILLSKTKGYQFRELPLEWRCDRDSRLNIFSSLFNILKEFFYLRRI